MIKLVFMDLDGTLMYRGSKISHWSWTGIRILQENKIDLCIATGRDLLGIHPLMKKLNTQYYILNNGALIYDYFNDKKVFEQFIDNKKLLPYMKKIYQEKHFVLIYAHNGIYTNKLNPVTKFLAGRHFYNLSECKDMKMFLNLKIYKVFVSASIFKKKKYKELIQDVRNDFIAVHVPFGFNINDKNISKGTAAQKLEIIMGVTFKKIACNFGDGHNDLTFLPYVLYFIATKNARKIVKQKATFVLTGNVKKQIYNGIKNIVTGKYK